MSNLSDSAKQGQIEAILLLAFGGPEKEQEVESYVERVAAGHQIPKERKQQVVRQYAQIGGYSPHNAITRKQAKALQEKLLSQGVDLPVFVAFQYTSPLISDQLRKLFLSQKKNIFVFILSLFECQAGWQSYQQAVAKAIEVNRLSLQIRYAPPLCELRGLEDAVVAQWASVLSRFSQASPLGFMPLFTAHSIPIEMAKHSPYVEQFQQLALRVAKRLGFERYELAYQSRSGAPHHPWLEPDVNAAIAQLTEEGVKRILLLPLGLLSDHAEVLYDLDIRAASTAKKHGVELVRAPTVGEQPLFIEGLAEIVLSELKSADG